MNTDAKSQFKKYLEKVLIEAVFNRREITLKLPQPKFVNPYKPFRAIEYEEAVRSEFSFNFSVKEWNSYLRPIYGDLMGMQSTIAGYTWFMESFSLEMHNVPLNPEDTAGHISLCLKNVLEQY